ncbi:hypothetical protein KIN20_031607 [Parelaphostrongylus tenuis]|uniref:SMB domain-containing protein n=1 Tax=Parelaphostrongylus tenuis TaxID=148309 RepID=A0AAD5WHR9_PARTN|nr:hypothetical protein KIN20_031607 [Parelaphostrongylus tenuis]
MVLDLALLMVTAASQVSVRASVDESFDDEKTNNMPKKVRRQKMKTSSSVAPKITHLFFGYPLKLFGPSEDILRYSVLDRYLPLMVSTTPALDFYDEDDEGFLARKTSICRKSIHVRTKARHPSESPQFMYLEKPPTSCYCDESSTALGDCCSDYTVVCPPQECVVSNWGDWEGCVADDGICGLGVEQRVRHVTQQPARGGTPCPPLKEMRTCFKLCTKRKSFDDIMNAIIYNKHIKSNSMLNSSRESPCNKRCASDLEDGEQGFWKLIGP